MAATQSCGFHFIVLFDHRSYAIDTGDTHVCITGGGGASGSMWVLAGKSVKHVQSDEVLYFPWWYQIHDELCALVITMTLSGDMKEVTTSVLIPHVFYGEKLYSRVTIVHNGPFRISCNIMTRKLSM